MSDIIFKNNITLDGVNQLDNIANLSDKTLLTKEAVRAIASGEAPTYSGGNGISVSNGVITVSPKNEGGITVDGNGVSLNLTTSNGLALNSSGALTLSVASKTTPGAVRLVNDNGLNDDGAVAVPNVAFLKTTLNNYVPTSVLVDGGSEASGKVIKLGSDGKIPTTALPSLNVTNVFIADNTANPAVYKTDLTGVERGDIAIEITASGSTPYILVATPASTADNWKKIEVPTGAVTSVKAGTVEKAVNGVATLGTAAAKDAGDLADNVPVLDSNGYLQTKVIPTGTANTTGAVKVPTANGLSISSGSVSVQLATDGDSSTAKVGTASFDSTSFSVSAAGFVTLKDLSGTYATASHTHTLSTITDAGNVASRTVASNTGTSADATNIPALTANGTLDSAVIPKATSTTIGGIKFNSPDSSGIDYDTSTGVLTLKAATAGTSTGDSKATQGTAGFNSNSFSVSSGFVSLVPATPSTLGGVIVPNANGLSVNGSGQLSLSKATTAANSSTGTLGTAKFNSADFSISPSDTGFVSTITHSKVYSITGNGTATKFTITDPFATKSTQVGVEIIDKSGQTVFCGVTRRVESGHAYIEITFTTAPLAASGNDPAETYTVLLTDMSGYTATAATASNS